ncbi:MAG: TIGR02530 family flagellar biosynthesis protein [Pseudobdellovibrionaceae bacterium]
MDIKKVSNFENLVKPEGVGSAVPGGMGKVQPQTGGPSFQETLSGLQGLQNPAVGKMPAAGQMQMPQDVKFSNHAVERMQTRGISFNKGDLERLNEAVSRAAAKGSKDTLVLMNDSALIVSVKNKTVVTVMDKTALKENVFTNIDSTIVM